MHMSCGAFPAATAMHQIETCIHMCVSIQVSCGAFPASTAMHQKFSLPIAVNIQPLNDAEVAEGFSAVPVVNSACV